MIHKTAILAAFFIAMIFLSACSSDQVFDEVVAIPVEGWAPEDTIQFHVAISDTSKVYNVLIHSRNEKTYPYSNLWLFVEATAPNGQTHADTLEVMLADNQGNWLGKGIGNVNTLLTPYLAQIGFRYRGIYTFTITQGMRERNLKGMLNIGLRVYCDE